MFSKNAQRATKQKKKSGRDRWKQTDREQLRMLKSLLARGASVMSEARGD